MNPQTQSNPESLELIASAVQVEASEPSASAAGGAARLRRFSMTAYTGGPMTLAGWKYPVVVDLEGLNLGARQRPILLDHTRDVELSCSPKMSPPDDIGWRPGKGPDEEAIQ